MDTWRKRAGLAQRRDTWAAWAGVPDHPLRTVWYLAQLQVANQTKKRYTSDLLAITDTEEEKEVLKQMQTLVKSLPKEYTQHAPPMALTAYTTLSTSLRQQRRLEELTMLVLAWRTAARFADLLSLRCEDVRLARTEKAGRNWEVAQSVVSMTIDWINSKTRPATSTRRWSVISVWRTDEHRGALQWLEKRLAKGSAKEMIFSMSERKVLSLLAEASARYTLHSVRRGSAQEVLRKIATEPQHAGSTLKEVSEHLRHAPGLGEEILSPTSLLYLEDMDILPRILASKWPNLL